MSDALIVICPTVTGREETFARCEASYRTSAPGEVIFISPKDEPTWGIGIQKGMDEAAAVMSQASLIAFTADDIEAHMGWYAAAMETLLAKKFPAPMLMNPDGSLFSYGHGDSSMFQVGPDWKPTNTSVVPCLLPEMWEGMAPMVPWHYWTDDYLSHKARQLGYEPACRHEYRFTHHVAQAGRGAGMTQDERMQHDMAQWVHYLNTGEMTASEAEGSIAPSQT